jgi:hypothetical protein
VKVKILTELELQNPAFENLPNLIAQDIRDHLGTEDAKEMGIQLGKVSVLNSNQHFMAELLTK